MKGIGCSLQIAGGDETINVLNIIDVYTAKITAVILVIAFLYVGYKISRNPHGHIATLWVCFTVFSITLAAFYFSNTNSNKMRVVFGTINSIAITAGHWKFVWHYFCSANDAQ